MAEGTRLAAQVAETTAAGMELVMEEYGENVVEVEADPFGAPRVCGTCGRIGTIEAVITDSTRLSLECIECGTEYDSEMLEATLQMLDATEERS